MHLFDYLGRAEIDRIMAGLDRDIGRPALTTEPDAPALAVKRHIAGRR